MNYDVVATDNEDLLAQAEEVDADAVLNSLEETEQQS